ncbi:MAG: hypothetical protein HYX69_19470 [Planctomycetia bacterium]|nr:hypothetical protein [Planctomycetia bacterium]
MSEGPDIYVALLGLPPGPRPPDYYALLGLPPLEPDVARIRAAAQRQMGLLTPRLTGPQASAARRLAGEVADARAILTTPSAKVLYDAQLPRMTRVQPHTQQRSTPSRSPAAAESDPGPIMPPRAAAGPAPVLPPRAVDLAACAADGDDSSDAARPIVTTPAPSGVPLGSSPVVLLSPDTEGAPGRSPAIPVARLVSAPANVPVANLAPTASPGVTMPILENGESACMAAAVVEGAPESIAAVNLSAVASMPATRRAATRNRAAQKRGPQTMIVGAAAGLLIALAAVGLWMVERPRGQSLGDAAPDSISPAARRDAGRGAAPHQSKSPPLGEATTRPRSRPARSTEAPSDEAMPDTPQASKSKPDVPPPDDKPMPPTTRPADKPEADVPTLDPKRGEAVRKSIAAARKALAERALDRADEQLDLALLDASSRELVAEVNAAKRVRQVIGEFWHAVDECKRGLKGTEELSIDGQTVVVVGVRGDVITVREQGKNQKYKNEDMTADLAVALADRWLADDDANSKVFIGAFLAIDNQGDAARGRQMLAEAAAAGTEAAKSVLEQLDR